jgi:hypothetical protein
MEEKNNLTKIKLTAISYYSRKDIQEAIFNFCRYRETVPNFNTEFFGKRPDCLDYPSDILALAKKGATSFHCSEELWLNPLGIHTAMTPNEYNEARKGWDFLIDIDSKYLDYSKIAARLIVKALQYCGVENFGIKFSGSKGFHLIVPWSAFPEEVNGIKTKDMFPEWPRAIAGYIDGLIKDKLNEEITRLTNPKEKIEFEVSYLPTGEVAIEGEVYEYICDKCRTKMTAMAQTSSRRKLVKCNICGYAMSKLGEEPVYFAQNKDNSKKNPHNFVKKIKTASLIDSVDIVLVAPRHLFRAPYSLHEKTALCSAVVKPEEIPSFVPSDADPLKIQIRQFYPAPKKDEAKKLLLNALDWVEKRQEKVREYEGKEIDLSGVAIDDKMFPPVINKLLEGSKSDGRKRSLGILISFFTFLNLPRGYIEEKLEAWNKKNYQPLKEGYIKSQLDWALRNKRLPPNYDKPIYKELGVFSFSGGFKNPINYTIREILIKKGKSKNIHKA